MNIVVASRQRTKKINGHNLKLFTTALLEELAIECVELGITLVGTGEMTRVNWQFLRHVGPTDVITFDYSCPRSPMPAVSPQLHGELFICVDDAVLQARRFKTSWQAEVIRYVVHGLLHLLGYDDRKPYQRREMKREENRLMRRLAARFSLAQLSRAARLAL